MSPAESAATPLLDRSVAERVLAHALRSGGEFAEVFVEDRATTSTNLDDGKIATFTSGRDRGCGIRVIVGDTTGFAHTADLGESGLLRAAEAAAAVAREGGGAARTVALDERSTPNPTTVVEDPAGVSKQAKAQLLLEGNEIARAGDPSIVQVMGAYADVRRRIFVANSDGLCAGDTQVRTSLQFMAVAAGDTGMQTGYDVHRVTGGFDQVRDRAPALARRAVDVAVTKLSARPAPTGEVTVVLGPASGGYIFHEACGHGLEADAISKGTSVYAGKVGEPVASPLVTFVDDATIPGEWGTDAIDDEGRPGQRTVLIQDGVLVEYMWDGLRARKDGRQSTSNGRRQSYQELPLPRMTNTFLVDGTSDPDSIIADTESGIYVTLLGGGQVDPTTGDFVFGMTQAFLIEGGRITAPLREANLIGNGPKVLHQIDAVANDFAMAPGFCGKQGQTVNVGSGQPTMRIHGLTVGGTAGA